ncbi:MAG: RNA methyltransferase [Melioribacter sp.]|nr:RNA methyltransferase [Melioribacter sp.]
MFSKNQLKYYSNLNQKKYRVLEQKILVEGQKLIIEALHSKLNCEVILTTNSFRESNPSFFRNKFLNDIKIELISHNDLERISDTQTPQGIIAVFEIPKYKLQNLGKEKIIIGLESIADPGNMGTIIRNCDWFGINYIITSNDCAESYNPKVIRSSAGSVFHINVIEFENFYEELDQLKKSQYKILVADLKGEDLYSFSNSDRTVIVFSNEAHGPSQELLNRADHILTIPRKGKAESLNVASASAIILGEFSRK